MVEIVYKPGSLFDAPYGSLLVHACNSRGVWGRGIAKEFKERFPGAFVTYSRFCQSGAQPGEALIVLDGGYYIGCLITSDGYDPPDEPNRIIANTYAALWNLSRQYEELSYNPAVYSNRFNSGLFGVPWTRTAHAVNFTWTGCDTWNVYEGK